MRREKTSVSQEDYLKAIWEIVQEEQVPISARLAEDLAVTPPGGHRCPQAHDPQRLPARSPRRPDRAFSEGQRHRAASRPAPPPRRKAAHRCDRAGMVSRARRGGAPRARHFCRSSRTPSETLRARESLPAWRSAGRWNVPPSHRLRRGQAFGGRGRPLATRFFASTKKTRSSSNFSTTCTSARLLACASISANTTKPCPSPSQTSAGCVFISASPPRAHLGAPRSLIPGYANLPVGGSKSQIQQSLPHIKSPGNRLLEFSPPGE